jgi:uncharacterized membrane protein YbhN (UPF0104 family)
MTDIGPGAAIEPALGAGPHPARRAAVFFVKYVVGISLIVWMVATGRVDLSVARTLPAGLIGACAALMAVQTVLAALRVRYILAHQGIRTGVLQCLLYNCAGVLYSAFLPGGISGDAVRAYLFMKAAPHHRMAILGAMLLDRLMGLISMVALGLAAAFYMAIGVEIVRPYLLGFTGIFAVLMGGLVFLHFIGGRHRVHEPAGGRIGRAWSKVRHMVAGLRIHDYGAGVLLFVVAQSVAIHVTAVLVIYLCSLHSSAGLDFLEVFVTTPIGLLVNAVPLSPGGLGIGENAFELLYRAIGGRHGGTSFLIARFFLYSPAVIGLAYVLKRMLTRRR